jgi:hypothetical protein
MYSAAAITKHKYYRSQPPPWQLILLGLPTEDPLLPRRRQGSLLASLATSQLCPNQKEKMIAFLACMLIL